MDDEPTGLAVYCYAHMARLRARLAEASDRHDDAVAALSSDQFAAYADRCAALDAATTPRRA